MTATTRPMPGPLEHDRMSWPHAGAPTSCDLCAALLWSDAKRLTDAECADECERAFDDFMDSTPYSSEMLRAREKVRVWERFATHPHALAGVEGEG